MILWGVAALIALAATLGFAVADHITRKRVLRNVRRRGREVSP